MEVSLETFFSALANPASILYTSDYSDEKDPGFSPFIQYVWTPYGTVCSTVVGYAYNMDIRYTTYEWEAVPGVYKIDPETEDIALCDVLCNGTTQMQSNAHMAIISAIKRKPDGSIYAVEVTEADIACVRKTWLTYSVFKNLYLSK